MKKATVSTLGPRPLVTGGIRDYRRLTGVMKDHWRDMLDQVLPDRPDLIVLPEVCDSFSDMPGQERPAYYAARGSQMLDFFADMAAANRCHIAYSAVMEEAGTLRNATRIIDRQGTVAGVYCKMHPTVGELGDGILPGRTAPIIGCDFGTVACAICFDLNFDDILAHYRANRPDIILFSSMYHGGLMQNYWAYACQSHFVGACAGLPCTVLSPLGEVLAESSVHVRFVTRTLNLDARVVHIDENMGHIRAARDKYGSRIGVSVPGLCNLMILSSETPEFTAGDVLSEFNIESWDDYYRRSLDRQTRTARP